MKVLRDFGPHSSEWQSVLALDEHMPWPWKADQWAHLDPKLDVVFLAETGNTVTGLALYRLSPLEELAHLLKVVVNPVFRRQGQAERFCLDQLTWLRGEQMKRVYLEVACDNEAALALYHKLGFNKLRRVQGFYQDGADAWTMEKALQSSI